MELQKQIEKDFLEAFKAKDEKAISALRMLKASLQNKQIEKRMQKTEILPDQEVIAVIRSEIKKRNDSAATYKNAGRDDLAAKESAEILVFEKYLPPLLSPEELKEAVNKIALELGVSGPADFGKLMGAVMAKVGANAEGQEVAKAVKERLSQA